MARAGVFGAAALGLVVALLQGLQSVVGTFNPRWEVTALFVVAGLGVSTLVQRLAARRAEAEAERARHNTLSSSLLEWPLPRLADVRTDRLGVFPPRRGHEDGRYAAREVDPPLRAALKDSPLVLVVGPARAGKSRTASEAARSALSAALTIVPRDADGLRALLELDPPLELAPDQAVVWLDSLERYIDALDGERLDELCERGVSVVATVRDDTWKRLLGGDGQQADAAKALAARARVYVLPARLRRDERARARQLYPGQGLRRGIGAAIASTGRESRKPLPLKASPEAEQAPASQPAARRDPWLLAPLAICTLALATVALLAVLGEFEKPTPPTIAEQAQQARRDGSAGPREVVDTERADFHGSGEPSYFLVFGDAGAVPAGRARSDEIQVFDQHGDELERVLRFEPKPLGSGNSAEPLLFQFRFIGDVDGDGADELIGGYGTPAIRGELLLPFAVDWDEDASRYRLVSLGSEPVTLETPGRGEDVAGLRAAYAQPLRIRDVEGEGTLAGYRSQDFAVSANPHRLVGAYVSDIRRDGAERRVELRPAIFRRTGGLPQVTPCRLLDTPAVVATAPSAKARPLQTATLEAWLKASKDRFCVPDG